MLAVKQWMQLILGGLVYYLCARFGMLLFSLQPSNITLLWLASGVGLILVLRVGGLALPVIFLVSLLANYPGMRHEGALWQSWHVLIAAAADTLVAFLAARFLKGKLPAGLQRASDLARFSFFVCFLPTAIGGLLIVLNLAWGGYIPSTEAAGLLRNLILSDSLGILLIYPLYQAWPAQLPHGREWGWVLANLLFCGVLLALDIWGVNGWFYFILPGLFFLVFRVPVGGVYLALLLAVAAIVALSAKQLGPFSELSAEEAHFMLQGFVFSTTYVSLSLALKYHHFLETDASGQHWQREALHDPLTGLLNRRGFTPLLANEHQRATRSLRPSALALIDIDHFKKINDRYGHPEGDYVLQVLAKVLSTQLRDIDSPARVGGEEFAILFPESSAAQGVLVLERVRQHLATHPLRLAGETVTVTFSAGVVEFAGGTEGVEQLFEAADRSLYTAKASGRNRSVMAT
ncbi:diguanylate cyclase (GGDEF)-like protein [Pseudomonas corrugata]|uniref:GGDEF domain-containing protein n=1 Tax=Pseudomonas corrugata TaxID=47879 RepID=UPI002855B741|nr:diguanylate cyclase [Pseudomonas corrugata]MDR7286227.1 diguanylate cyclase (GGDEF)-like protein [Pseudomonas corrugata]